MKFFSLKLLLNSLWESYQRFPGVSISSWVATALAILIFEGQLRFSVLHKLLLTISLAVPILLSLSLLQEKYRLSDYLSRYLYAVLTGFLAIYFFSLPQQVSYPVLLNFFLFFACFTVSISFAPHIFSQNPLIFWHYNQVIIRRFFISLLYTAGVSLGVAMGLLAIQHLFFHITVLRFHEEVLIFMFGVFHLSIFIAGIPQDIDGLAMRFYPQWMQMVSKLMLLPFASLYILILLIFIIDQGVFPRVYNATMVYWAIGVGLFSLLSYIFLYPVLDQEKNRKFRHWLRLGGISICIPLCYSVQLCFYQVSEQGLTEYTYLNLALLFWIIGVMLYFLVKPNPNLKVIPVSLSFILFLAAFGPWGASSLSNWSQTQRVIGLFEQNKLLEEDVWLRADTSILPMEDREEILDILNYLSLREKLNLLPSPEKLGVDSLRRLEISPALMVSGVLNHLGNLSLIDSYEYRREQDQKLFEASKTLNLHKVQGYDYQIPFSFYTYRPDTLMYKADSYQFHVFWDPYDNQLVIAEGKNLREVLHFDFNMTLSNLMQANPEKTQEIRRARLTLLEESKYYRAKLYLQEVKVIELRPGMYHSSFLKGEILIRLL